jgi:hypothetical protein
LNKYFISLYLSKAKEKFPQETNNINWGKLHKFTKNILNKLLTEEETESQQKIKITKYIDFCFNKNIKSTNSVFAYAMVDSFFRENEINEKVNELKYLSSGKFEGDFIG